MSNTRNHQIAKDYLRKQYSPIDVTDDDAVDRYLIRLGMLADFADHIMDEQPTDSCRWKEDEDGNWFTGCMEGFVFMDGGPVENSFKFCCYCGGKLITCTGENTGETPE